MGLGDLLLNKKSTKGDVAKIPPATLPKKMDIRKVKIASRSIYDTRIKFREIQGHDALSLKKIIKNGERLDKQKLAAFYHVIAQKNKRDLTYGDFEKHLQNYQRNHIKMTWYDKQKLLKMVKGFAEKEMPAQKVALAQQRILKAKPHSEEIQQKKEEKLKSSLPDKFLSPKSQATNADSITNRLGIKTVNSDFKMGHAVNPASLGMSSDGQVKPNLSKGMVSGGRPGVTGLSSGRGIGVGGGGLGLGGRPRIGGL